MLNRMIENFFQSKAFAVIGASNERFKYGNKVLRCYLENGYVVYPVNPNAVMVEDLNAYKSVADLPPDVKSISIVTPPAVTEQVVEEAIKKGIKNIWMQPGAESKTAIKRCLDQNLNVIAGGPCILVELGFREPT